MSYVFQQLNTHKNKGDRLLKPISLSDQGGTQTHDLQNRNLTLYSTKLPSQQRFNFNAKISIYWDNSFCSILGSTHISIHQTYIIKYIG